MLYPEITYGLPRVRAQWPEAVSSLTVARQRGIFTRFPVFALAKTRVPQKIQRAESSVASEFTGSSLAVSTAEHGYAL
jgi:hypothetical protein